MNCAEIERDESIERYLRGELVEEEVRELEEHYLICERCFEALEDLRALRSELSEERWAARDEALSSTQSWTWTWVAVAAALLVAVGLGVWLWPGPRIGEAELARLGAVETPPYTGRQVRGRANEGERAFRAAMKPYAEGSYAEAIPALERLEPRTVRADFYLGACYLLVDRLEPAIETLGRVVESGNPRYLESARFYRGKAHLRAGDLEAARADFEAVANLGGDRASEARSMLDQLPR